MCRACGAPTRWERLTLGVVRRRSRESGEGNGSVGHAGQGLGQGLREQALDEILAAPPSALAGLSEKHDEILAGLGIKSIADLGSNKYFAFAGVLVALAGKAG